MLFGKSVIVLGTSVLMFGSGIASAQLDVGAAGRAAAGIGAAGGSAAGGTGAAAGGIGDAAGTVGAAARGIGDAEVAVHVQSSLSQELRMPGVRSDVRNGVATLNGTVANEADKQRAEQIARRVDGVARVRNQLVVEGSSSAAASAGGRLDQQSRAVGSSTDAAVTSRLRSDTRLAQRDIDVRTRHDVVTLTGQVQSVAEKEAAGRIAAEAAAGAEVRNRLSVRTKD